MSRFDRLYRDNFPFVWAAAHRCGAPADVVDDVVQDVFVTAYRRLDELHWEVSPRGWLYGVTRRIAFRYRRTAARTVRRQTAVAAASKRAERPHHQRDAARALELLLEQLEETQRQAFVMAEVLGMTGPEIAAETAVPLNTVYSRLRLAKRRLAALAGSEHQLAQRIEATQRADTPTAREQQQVYAALMPVVGSTWLPFKTGAIAALKSAALPLAAGAVALTSYVVSRSLTSDAPPADQEAPAQVRSRERPYGPYAPTPVPVVADDEASVAAAGINPAPPAVATNPAAAVTPATAPATRTVGAPPSGGVPGPSSESLAAEVSLLDRAKAALDGGDASASLAALDEHARRFPQGQLSEARDATRVRALCKAGRPIEAETAAAALHRSHPDSNLARQTPAKCP